MLVSKLGRSSKPSPRYLILTDKAVYILISQAVQNQVQTTLERKIPLVTIRSVGLSNLRDDWMALNTTSQEEGDPLISCVFKTEFLVHLQQRTNGAVQINIGPTCVSRSSCRCLSAADLFASYSQHPVLEEEGQDGDNLVQEGRVYPARRRLQVVDRQRSLGSASNEPVRPALRSQAEAEEGGSAEAGQRESLRPLVAHNGTDSNCIQRPTGAKRPTPQSLPGAAGFGAVPAAPAGIPRAPPAPQAPAAKAAPVSTGRTAPPPPTRAPAPPPPRPEPEVEQYKACVPIPAFWVQISTLTSVARSLFAFETDQPGELPLKKDDILEVVTKDDGGWWLIKKGSQEGWAPSNVRTRPFSSSLQAC